MLMSAFYVFISKRNSKLNCHFYKLVNGYCFSPVVFSLIDPKLSSSSLISFLKFEDIDQSQVTNMKSLRLSVAPQARDGVL